MESQAKADVPPPGVYLHVPFCGSACDFCAFYQEAPDRAQLEAYLDGIERELQLVPPPAGVATVFWGGGTPGLLPAGDLDRLAGALRRALGSAPQEWTVEMAPATVKADKLEVLRAHGVTRISLGVQTFDDGLMAKIGRRHSPAQAEKALAMVRDSGFATWNIDLMFALPGQTAAQWEADLRTAVATGAPHLSTYCLTFEDDTALYARLRQGQVEALGDEGEVEYLDIAAAVLGEAGLGRYEVSNHARPGHVCWHNLHTWQMGEWQGYGPSAASQRGGQRFTNVPDLTAWLAGLQRGQPHRVDVQPLNDATLAADALAFGLRMAQGVDLARLRRRFPACPYDRLEALFAKLAAEGLAEWQPGARLCLTQAGLHLADAIAVEVLSALEDER